MLYRISKNGSDNIDSINFEVSNTEELQLKAISLAMINAKEKAQSVLKDANHIISSIKSCDVISEEYKSIPIRFSLSRSIPANLEEASKPTIGEW